MDYLTGTDGLADKVAIEFKNGECRYWDITGKDVTCQVKNRIHEIELVKKAIENAQKLDGAIHFRTSSERANQLIYKHNCQRKYQLRF